MRAILTIVQLYPPPATYVKTAISESQGRKNCSFRNNSIFNLNLQALAILIALGRSSTCLELIVIVLRGLRDTTEFGKVLIIGEKRQFNDVPRPQSMPHPHMN
jgi:hypothetical protein